MIKKTSAYIRNAADARRVMAQMESQFAAFAKEVADAGQAATDEALELIAKTAYDRTPKDTGNLRDSQYIDTANEGDRYTGVVGYSRRGEADYAVHVHENMEAHHPVGQAKFLESAVIDTEEEVRRIFEKHLRGVVQ